MNEDIFQTAKPCLASRLFYFVKDGVEEVDDPPLCKVVDAIKRLDGIDIDTVSVTLHNGDSMDIGGGKDNQYKCHARTKNSFYDLVNPNCQRDIRDTISIMMCNELSKYPKCCIVSFDMAMVAAECFCTSGELSPTLTWDNTLEYEPL
jgi:hypothetical protein